MPRSMPRSKPSARTLASHLSQAASATVAIATPRVRSSSSKAGKPDPPPVLRAHSARAQECSASRNALFAAPGKRADSLSKHGSSSCGVPAACSRTVADTRLSKGQSWAAPAPEVKPPPAASRRYAWGCKSAKSNAARGGSSPAKPCPPGACGGRRPGPCGHPRGVRKKTAMLGRQLNWPDSPPRLAAPLRSPHPSRR